MGRRRAAHTLGAFIFAAAYVSLPSIASAQLAPPPGDDSSAPANAEQKWRADFDKAREELLAGEFATARDEFDRLARTAQNDVDNALAVEDRDLAASWLARDLALVRRVDLGETTYTPKAVDRRTSDEIVSLYTASVFYGIGTGEWIGVAIASGERSNPGVGTFVIPPILMTAASVATVAIADSAHTFRYGGAQSVVSGTYVGFEEGLVWTLVDETVSDDRAHMSPTAAASLIWGATTAGAIGGGIIGGAHATTPGRASFVGSAALWTSVITGSTAAAFTSSRSGASAPLTVAGVGLNAGLVAGFFLAEPVSPTIARVRFLDLGGASGYLVGAGLYAGIANDHANAQAALGCAALGGAVGLTTAWLVTSSMQDDRLGGRSHNAGFLEKLTPTIAPLDHGAALVVQESL